MKDEINRMITFSYDLWFWVKGQNVQNFTIFKRLPLRQITRCDHQTWSQEPLDRTLYRVFQANGQRSRRGHKGQ